MDESVTSAEANRSFSRLLRGVREGRSYVVTSHGRPVAKLVPADAESATATGARRSLLERLARQDVVHIGQWTRDELNDD